MASEEHPTLRIRIRNKKPVELSSFAASYRALSDEFDGYVGSRDAVAVSPEVTLHVARVRAGSIVTELIAMAPFALPFIENANSIIEFAVHLRTVVDVLLGRSHSGRELTRNTLQNIGSIVDPVARDGGAQFNVQTKVYGDLHLHLSLDAVKANAVQNAARRSLEGGKARSTGSHSKVLLYLHQARNDSRSSVGDRAIIETISPGPVKVVFATEALKSRVIQQPQNPFRCVFVVDVDVGTVNGRPTLYTVTALHDVFEHPDAA